MIGAALANLVRRSRLRRLIEGAVQRVRAEATDHEAHDDCERWQDYGFAANPVDGQGLRLCWGGHTIVLRMDRIAERPQLAAYEVAVWHRNGAAFRIKDGRLVQIDCDRLVINASVGVEINTPEVSASGVITAPTVAATSSLMAAGAEVVAHVHSGVDRGGGSTDPLV